MMTTPSRQRRYQQRHKAAGLCHLCPEPAVGKTFCRLHLDLTRDNTRNRYRLAHGISLDKPLGKQGRPRNV